MSTKEIIVCFFAFVNCREKLPTVRAGEKSVEYRNIVAYSVRNAVHLLLELRELKVKMLERMATVSCCTFYVYDGFAAHGLGLFLVFFRDCRLLVTSRWSVAYPISDG